MPTPMPMSEWGHLPGKGGLCLSSWLDGKIPSSASPLVSDIIRISSSDFFRSFTLFRVRCALSVVQREGLGQTASMSVCVTTGATVILRLASASVLTALPEQGVNVFV